MSADRDRVELLELYKMYVEMADRVSARRQGANNYYLAVNTALIGATATFLSTNVADYAAAIVAISGLSLCLMWKRNIQSYKDLNSGKFAVIQEIEKDLVFGLYTREWEILERGEISSKYRPFHKVESWVPNIFIILYGSSAVLVLDYDSLIYWICSVLN